jgi:hypothetical protein
LTIGIKDRLRHCFSQLLFKTARELKNKVGGCSKAFRLAGEEGF